MASARSHIRLAAQAGFEPLFPRPQAAPPPVATDARPTPEQVLRAELEQRVRAAREDGRGEGYATGHADGVSAADAAAAERFSAALQDLEAGFAAMRTEHQSLLDEQVRAAEQVITKLAERLSAPASRETVATLFRRHVLDVVGVRAQVPAGVLLLAPETIAELARIGSGFVHTLASRGVEVAPRQGLSPMRAQLETGEGTTIAVDFDALLDALQRNGDIGVHDS